MVIFMKDYGKILKEHRLARNKTLLDVQKDTGINNANLSRWENGKVLPSIAYCEQLADYYGISIDVLVGHELNKSAIGAQEPFSIKAMVRF